MGIQSAKKETAQQGSGQACTTRSRTFRLSLGGKTPVELVNTKFMIPFGMGRSAFLNESFARQELQISFVGLMQHFKVFNDPSNSSNPSNPFPLPIATDSNNKLMTRFPFSYHIRFKYIESSYSSISKMYSFEICFILRSQAFGQIGTRGTCFPDF